MYYSENNVYIIYITETETGQVIMVYSLPNNSDDFKPMLYTVKRIPIEEGLLDADSCIDSIGYTIADRNMSFISFHKNNVLRLWIIDKNLPYDEFKLPESDYKPVIVRCCFGKVAVGYELIKDQTVYLNIKIFGCLSSVNRFHLIESLNYECKEDEYDGLCIAWSEFQTIKPTIAIGYGKSLSIYYYEYGTWHTLAKTSNDAITESIHSLIWTLNGNLIVTCNNSILCFSSWIVPRVPIQSKYNHTIIPHISTNNIISLTDHVQFSKHTFVPTFMLHFFSEGGYDKVKYLIKFIYDNTIEYIKQKEEDETLGLKTSEYIIALPYLPVINLLSTYNELEPYYLKNETNNSSSSAVPPMLFFTSKGEFRSRSNSRVKIPITPLEKESNIFDEFTPALSKANSVVTDDAFSDMSPNSPKARDNTLEEMVLMNRAKKANNANKYIREKVVVNNEMIDILIKELPV